jgi:hypothetical protein
VSLLSASAVVAYERSVAVRLNSQSAPLLSHLDRAEYQIDTLEREGDRSLIGERRSWNAEER